MSIKKILLFVVLFTGLVCILAAQSINEFEIIWAEHMNDFSTWELFVSYTSGLVEYSQQQAGSKMIFQWVKERTILEDQLVSWAYRQLPERTNVGYAWQVHIGHRYSLKRYDVFIYSDQDGKRYYRLLRIIGFRY